MDFFSWLPVIIFIYVVSTIFGSSSKKGPKQRPSDRTRGSHPSSSPNSQQRKKSKQLNWRDMLEELEQELFPRDIPPRQPKPATSPSPTSSTVGYEHPEYSGEGVWGAEGRAGAEGSFSYESDFDQGWSSGREGRIDVERDKVELDKPVSKPSVPLSASAQDVSPAFITSSQNPVVQGIIWAEVLGKPRGYNKMAYKRRI